MRLVDTAKTPHLAATEIEDSPRAVELLGQVNRLPIGGGGSWVGEVGQHRGPRLRTADRLITVDAVELAPYLLVGR